MPRAILKANAKDALRGNWGIAILSLLIGTVLVGAASFVFGIGELIVIGPIETGLALIYMKLSYRDNPEIGDLFAALPELCQHLFRRLPGDAVYLPVVSAAGGTRHCEEHGLFPDLLHYE